MSIDVAAEIIDQSIDELKPIVEQILGMTATPFGELIVNKIGRSIGQGTVGIFHIAGQALTDTGSVEWTAVVKALGQPAIEVAELGDNDASRELAVYRSGVFARICGGVRSANVYAIQSRADLLLLWLEDLSHAPQPPWTSENFISTARDLGRFNAHWPEIALPKWDWLNERGFRNQFIGFFHRLFHRIPINLNHPLMLPFSAYKHELLQLWDQCETLLLKTETIPIGVCHLDCHPKNLFPIVSSSGEHHTVAIDWANVGIDHFGIDIGHMLGSSTLWMEISPDQAFELRDPIFDAYLVGLSESGWSGNEETVRLSFLTRLICEAIRQICLVSHAIDDEGFRKMEENLMQRPMTEINTRYAEFWAFYADCRDESQQIAARL